VSLLGGLIGGAVGFIGSGFNPAGAVAGYQAGQSLTTKTAAPAGPGAPPSMFGGGGFNIPFPVKGPGGIPLPGFGPSTPPAGGSCAKGYHLNRKPLAASRSHGAVPAHSMCVRNRHINPLNARAITRSLRRVKRARKLVAKLQSFGGTRRIASGGHRAGCGCFRCRKR